MMDNRNPSTPESERPASHGTTPREGEPITTPEPETEHARGRIHEAAQSARETRVGGAVADRMDHASAYIREHSMSEVADNLSDVIRRHPIQSVLVSAGIGYLLGRILEP